MKTKDLQIFLSCIVIILLAVVIYKLTEQSKTITELDKNLSEQNNKLDNLLSCFNNFSANANVLHSNNIELEPREPIGFKVNKKTDDNIMFAKRRANVLNLGFCAFYKLCA